MKNNFKISFLLAASVTLIMSSCGKTELVAPNGNVAGNVDGVEKSFFNTDGNKGDGSDVNTFMNTRDGELDPNNTGGGSGGNTGNDDGGKPDPNGGSFIGDDDNDSDLGNNSGKSLVMNMELSGNQAHTGPK